MPFNKTTLKLAASPLVNKLTGAYLNGDHRIEPLYALRPQADSIDSLIKNRESFKINRSALTETLLKQYNELEAINEVIPDQVRVNIDALKQENCFTVTTGHQLQVAGGPLFFSYKILSAIKTASYCNEKNKNIKAIPVLWLASEDHDILEINHFNCLGKKYQWDSNYQGPAGKADTGEISKLIDQLISDLGQRNNTEIIKQLLENVYVNGRSLSMATRILVNRLFGKYGLVIIDPDTIELKSQFKELIKQEIFQQTSLNAINQTINSFPKDFEVQANPREINFFYFSKDGRNRIEKHDDFWKVINTNISFKQKELIDEIDHHPEKFSPNVLLRPLFQEMILPNIAYIGGPAELAYWLELKKLFSCYAIPYPMILHRNSFLMLDHQTVSRMVEFGIQDSNLFDGKEKTINSWIEKIETGNFFQTANLELENVFSAIEKEMALADPTLSNSVKAELQRTKKGINHLEEKWT